MQQSVEEDLSRRSVVKTLSRGVVVERDGGEEALLRESGEIGFSGDEATQATDGVFDAALLPRGVRITEEGLDGVVVELVMASELGAIVEGDGLSERRRQGGEESEKMLGDGIGFFAGRSRCDDQPAVAIVNGENGLAVFGKENEVGFPMSRGLSIGSRTRALSHGNPGF